MSDFVLDASLTLQWFLNDEVDRKYGLSVLSSMAKNRAIVPVLWFYEVGNALVMACRRKRITSDKIEEFLLRLKALPIDVSEDGPSEILALPKLAQSQNLTNYDAAYLALAINTGLPLATKDAELLRVAPLVGVSVFAAN